MTIFPVNPPSVGLTKDALTMAENIMSPTADLVYPQLHPRCMPYPMTKRGMAKARERTMTNPSGSIRYMAAPPRINRAASQNTANFMGEF